MASVLFEKNKHPLFEQIHRALCAWRKRHLQEHSIHITDVLTDPRDQTFSFLVSFPDAREKEFTGQIQEVVTRVATAEKVSERWFLAQGRPECA